MSGTIHPVIGKVPELRAYRVPGRAWKDGLVVRMPNWLGDAVMALPALRQLRLMLPSDCGLFVVSPPSLGEFFHALPIVDYTLVLTGAHKAWSLGELRALRGLQAGAGLLFNNSLRDVLHFRMALVPRLYGAAARGRGLLLTGAWKMPKRVSRDLNKFHHAAKYLAMSAALGAPEWDGFMPEFKVALEPETCSPELNAALAQPRILGLAAGAAYGPAKRWPAGHFREIAKRWLDSGGSVVTLGNGAEREICSQVLEGFPGERAFNLAGRTSLTALMALMKKSDFLVANDSGVMHLAAAMGVPGAAIFGSTDPSATSPVSTKWRVFYEKRDCSPCFSRECPLGTCACLKNVSADAVWSELESLCRREGSNSPAR